MSYLRYKLRALSLHTKTEPVCVHYLAVRMPCRAMKSLEKALLASSCAAAALGPKQGTPARCRASLIPATRGTSGPTTARATPLRTAN
eukprot:14313-Heterococcus_DN1.PRE.2